ncbi:MAG: helix-turn-helix domain-containing protein [Gemmataceae bacterium]
MDARFFSPAEVSRALGVSTSTIKRWVDQGVLPAHKTAGGHRKILRADVLRLVRAGSFPHLDLTLLMLPDNVADTDTATLSQLLLGGLKQGDIALIRSAIHGAYAARLPLEILGDDVIVPAMTQLGHEWQEGQIDVMHEHRGTHLCITVLHELRPALEMNAQKDRPIAVGGNPEGDHSSLASLLIELMLLDTGWDAVNLGPATPLSSFRLAIDELKPCLVWLSVNYLSDFPKFVDEYRQLHQHARDAGVAVVIGGQALPQSLFNVVPSTCHGSCLADLAQFVRTLHQRPTLPKRGRPCHEVS